MLHLWHAVTHSPQEGDRMNTKYLHLKNWLALPALATFLCLGTPASAQSAPAQPAQNNAPVQDNDTTRQELANFDQFLDSHPETAEQLRRDPSQVNNEEFLKSHPALQTYLQDHPQVREELKENPNAFMRQEDRYDRRTDDRDRDRDRGPDRQELAHFDQFLDSHHEIAEQLRKDPSLVNNDEFVRNHPALQSYLRDHPNTRQQIRDNPTAFMRQEDRYDRRADDRDGDHDRDRGRDRGADRQELARFDQFLDSHHEIAEQLRKDPSLVNNDEFVKNHPALQSYLRDHPETRQQIKDNPNAFMRQEDRFDRRTDDRDRDRDRGPDRQELARFDQFLDNHREIAQQLRKDPSLVNNDEFVKNHPALQTYLRDHPEIREQIRQNPTAFMQQEARYERHEDGMDRDTPHKQFGEFLGGHSDIAQQLSKDPSLVKNQEYMENHPDLRDYLNSHPDVRQGLMQNPPAFVKTSQQFTETNGAPKAVVSPAEPKPKQ
jgi:phage-related protein